MKYIGFLICLYILGLVPMVWSLIWLVDSYTFTNAAEVSK